MQNEKFDKALKLRSIITALATGGTMDSGEFLSLRSEFLNDQNTRKILPEFIRNNVDGDGVWLYFRDFHTGEGAYDARRKHIKAEFQPLISFLSEIGAPVDADVTSSLTQYNADAVSDAWQKALNRRKADPEGAITSARTLLEEVCRHILEDAGENISDKWDLPKLYTEVARNMNLAPSQHAEEVFKRILGGCQNIVESLGGLRNKISDAHGGGRKKVKPSERHAALAVNLAGSMAMFLVETWMVNQAKQHAKSAKAVNKQKDLIYKDVHLASRYDYAFEIRDMQKIIDSLVPDMARRIEAIWCDSKANAFYIVTVRKGLWVPDLQWALADAGRAIGGYNGVYFDGDVPSGIDLDPWWPVETE